MPHKAPTSSKAKPAARRPDNRPSRSKRGYGRSWQRVRLAVLSDRPMCEEAGCREAGTEVDHVVSLVDGGTHEATNLRVYCKRHHSMKTCREDGGFGRKRTRQGPGTPTRGDRRSNT